MKKFTSLIMLITFANSNFAFAQTPDHPVLSNQTTDLIEGATCTADAMEEEELEQSADVLEEQYNKQRKKAKKKALKGNDPYQIEAALNFFAPSIFPDQYSTPLTTDTNILKDFEKVCNYDELNNKNSTAVSSNPNAFNPEKTNFLDDKIIGKDGKPSTITEKQKQDLQIYQDMLLGILMENQDCDHFTFDLTKSKFSTRYFSEKNAAEAFMNNHELHAEKLERCDGVYEKKNVNVVPKIIANSEQTLECPGLENFFMDNQWEIHPDKVMSANSKYYYPGTCNEIKPCDANNGKILEMQGRLKSDAEQKYAAAKAAIDSCVAKLKDKEIMGVDIESSASRYKNTGIACDKSFSELSLDRARTAQTLLFNSLDEHKIHYKTGTAKKPEYLFNVYMDYGGEWGAKIDALKANGETIDPKLEKLRGSSGPAPGVLDRAEYNQYKYVRISIRYKDKAREIPKEDQSKKFQVLCKTIGYTCTYEQNYKTIKQPRQRSSRGSSTKPKHTKPLKKKKSKTKVSCWNG